MVSPPKNTRDYRGWVTFAISLATILLSIGATWGVTQQTLKKHETAIDELKNRDTDTRVFQAQVIGKLDALSTDVSELKSDVKRHLRKGD